MSNCSCCYGPAAVHVLLQVAFLEAPSFEAVQAVLARAKAQLGEILSAVEFLDAESMSMVTQHLEGVRNPLSASGSDSSSDSSSSGSGEQGGPFYMVVETSGSHEAHDAEKLEAFLEVSNSACVELVQFSAC